MIRYRYNQVNRAHLKSDLPPITFMTLWQTRAINFSSKVLPQLILTWTYIEFMTMAFNSDQFMVFFLAPDLLLDAKQWIITAEAINMVYCDCFSDGNEWIEWWRRKDMKRRERFVFMRSLYLNIWFWVTILWEGLPTLFW